MKKLFLIIAMIFATTLTSFADDERVSVVINKKEQTSSKNTWERAPMRIPVEVYYNSDLNTITIIGDESVTAEVFLYNASGMLENYSSSLNTVFTLASSGEYTVLIQGEGWYGTATII